MTWRKVLRWWRRFPGRRQAQSVFVAPPTFVTQDDPEGFWTVMRTW